MKDNQGKVLEVPSQTAENGEPVADDELGVVRGRTMAYTRPGSRNKQHSPDEN